MNAPARTRLALLRQRLEDTRARLTIDADTHISDPRVMSDAERERFETGEYYHGRPISAEGLIQEMDLARVDMALVWQNPSSTAYSDDAERNAEALAEANRYVFESAERHPERLIPAGWVDPKACGLRGTLALVERLVGEFGAFLVKLNPAQNEFMMDSPDAVKVVDCIVDLGAVPAFHFGADTPYTPPRALRAIALRHPGHPVMAVHMGGGGAGYMEAEATYREARALGLERPEIRYALSTKRDAHIESDLIAYQLAGEPFCHNLFCASDAPFGKMTWNFGAFRGMFDALAAGEAHTDPRVRSHPGLFTEAAIHNYMGLNFARFAAESCARIAETVCR